MHITNADLQYTTLAQIRFGALELLSFLYYQSVFHLKFVEHLVSSSFTMFNQFCSHNCCLGGSDRLSTMREEGRVFDPRLGHTNDYKNGSNNRPPWN